MKCYCVVDFRAPLQEMDQPTPVPQGAQVLLKVRAAGVCHSDIHLWEGGYDLGQGRTLSLNAALRCRSPWATKPSARWCRPAPTRPACGPAATTWSIPGSAAATARRARRARRTTAWPRPAWACTAPAATPTTCSCRTPLPDRHRRPGPGADRTLRLLRPDHLCRAEEDRRADLSPASRGDLRRGRPGTDVPDAHQGAGRRRRHRGGHRPRQAPGGAGGRRAGGHRRRGPGRGAADHQAAGGKPAQAAIDLVGAPATTSLAFDFLTKGGKLIIVGLFGGGSTWPIALIPMKALSIIGSYVGNLAELKELMELVRAGKVPPMPVHRYALTRPTACWPRCGPARWWAARCSRRLERHACRGQANGRGGGCKPDRSPARRAPAPNAIS